MPQRLHQTRHNLNRGGQRSGFTLIELAISMLIITLLATVLLTPISTQITQSRMTQAKADLDQINEALIGFALAQGKPRLPCPDATTGAGANDGVEESPCGTNAGQSVGGNVPWVTLNVPAFDPWGQRYQYRVNTAYTDTVNGFTLATAPTGACVPPGVVGTGQLFTTAVGNGQLRICGDSGCATTLANTTVPAVIFSRGPNGATGPTGTDEIENTDNDCLFVSRTYAAVGGAANYDDLLVWISPGVLMSRMVTAQKLP